MSNQITIKKENVLRRIGYKEPIGKYSKKAQAVEEMMDYINDHNE